MINLKIMNIFKFIYYCVYQSVFLANKKNQIGVIKAATGIFTIPLYIISITFYFISIFFLPKGFIYFEIYSLIVIFLIFLFNNKFCKYYFIKKENYKVAINLYENKISNINAVIVVLLYYILSFAFLVVVAENADNIRDFLGTMRKLESKE